MRGFFTFVAIIFLSFLSICSDAQVDSVLHRVILIGDAGKTTDGKIPVVEKARALFDMNDKTTVIFLGDNVYEHGMPSPEESKFDEKREVMDAQISLVKDTKAKAYFIPGNHDWNKGKNGGLRQLANQQEYIESLQLDNVEMMPKDGCPGPEELIINDKLVIVFMDSEWWLEQFEKPGIGSDCPCRTEDEIVTALKEIASLNSDKLMLVAMHHPFYTHGTHGGYYTIRQHIFPFTDAIPKLYIPLPIIGSIYPITRGIFGTPQDIFHPGYRTMINQIEAVLKTHPNVIHAAGHEHNLQFLSKDSISYIVSGAGAKTTQVKQKRYSQFAASELGFAVVEITQSGKVSVKYYGTRSDTPDQPIFSTNLKTIKPPPEKSKTIEEIVENFPDSVEDVGSKKLGASGLKKFLLGYNYRKEWAEPIKVKVLDIGKDYGGLYPYRRGGGHQTKSLRLKDSTGKQWQFRLVEKSVTEEALPTSLRGTFAKDLISDGVSASYPYAALSVPILANAAGIPHANPVLYHMPDDPRLGKYRIEFANTLGELEEREPGGFDKTINTGDLAKKLAADNDNHLDQHSFLKARLFDMYIMDFDRHEGQWHWGVIDEEKGHKYVAIPRDRDQAFFINVGVLPRIASWKWISPQVQGFRSKARNIRIYNYNARNIDRAFLNQMNEEDWKKGTEEIVAALQDPVIEKALAQQPEPIKKYQYSDIIRKLKERRNYYPGEMMNYYRFISKIVNIPGSNKKELYEINREADGFVTVTVHKITKEGEVSFKMYERRFDPAVTKEIRLYGLGGDDKFVIQGTGSRIKIRIIGGNGADTYENNSGGKVLVYDLNTEENRFSGNIKKKLSDVPLVNNYDESYNYNLWVPFLSLAYNPDDGFSPGASLTNITYGFRKYPYAMRHHLAVNHSLATNAYNIRLNSEFIKVIKNYDLLLNADIKGDRNVTNFFGYGNETLSFIDSKPGRLNYYRTRYKLMDFSMLLRKGGKAFSFSFGPSYQLYDLDSAANAGRIIVNPSESGLVVADIAQKKSFFGGLLNMHIDTRNSSAIPLRGINWNTTFKVMAGMNDASSHYTQLNTDMSVYMSFSRDPRFVFATRIGYGVNFGNYEFFQAQYLGNTSNMRGFRNYRFAGKSVAYSNTDLRYKLADFRSYLFPGSIGLLVFNDFGKVWAPNSSSGKWHQSYGGGIWVAPLKRAVIAFSIGISKEETLPLVSFGFQF